MHRNTIHNSQDLEVTNLEMIILSEVSWTKTNIWYHMYMESDTNELIYKTEADSQT